MHACQALKVVVIVSVILSPPLIIAFILWRVRSALAIRIVDALGTICIVLLPMSLLSLSLFARSDDRRLVPIVIAGADIVPFLSALARLTYKYPKIQNLAKKHPILLFVIFSAIIQAFAFVMGVLDRRHGS